MRNNRPHVVVIEGLKLPSSSRESGYNAQYCSLFFRPWTLLQGDKVVPNFSLLALDRSALSVVYDEHASPLRKVARSVQKSHPHEPIVQKFQWHHTWSEYVRGHIVSNTAKDLIQSFLLRTIASSQKDAEDVDSEADESGSDTDIPRLHVEACKFQELLQSASTNVSDEKQDNDATESKSKKFRQSVSDRQARKQAYESSIRIGEAVWKTQNTCGAADDREKPGHMYEDVYQDHLTALSGQGEAMPRCAGSCRAMPYAVSCWRPFSNTIFMFCVSDVYFMYLL